MDVNLIKNSVKCEEILLYSGSFAGIPVVAMVFLASHKS